MSAPSPATVVHLAGPQTPVRDAARDNLRATLATQLLAAWTHNRPEHYDPVVMTQMAVDAADDIIAITHKDRTP